MMRLRPGARSRAPPRSWHKVHYFMISAIQNKTGIVHQSGWPTRRSELRGAMRLGAACLAPTATEDAGREEFSAGNHRKLTITRAGLAVWAEDR
jgi:hypothetical protein